MHAPSASSNVSNHVTAGSVLPEELEFYQSYEWSLNPYLTVSEAVDHLRGEVDRLAVVPRGWQSDEVSTNIFLLACGVLNCIDEYLHGITLRLPRRVAATVAGRGANWLVEKVSDKPWSRRRQVARWRNHWLLGLNDFLSLIVRGRGVAPNRLAESGGALSRLLDFPLPADLLALRLSAPIPFRRLDLTQQDVIALGKSFARRFPDRTRPLLLLGLRTTGSYFAPLLRAFFEAEGYEGVVLLTVEPKQGASRKEKEELQRFATRGYWGLVVDDAPNSSGTVLAGFNIARQAGFAPGDVKILAPTHPAKPAWFKTLPEDSVITLPPQQWHKRLLLDPKAVELRLAEYFCSQNFPRVSVVTSHRATQFNAQLQCTASDERGVRLKCIFEILLETREGKKQTKYILAKSVGWGWLGYHAFLSGHRLGEYVPPILGLRDGILYMEWVPQPEAEAAGERYELADIAASYVAARVKRLHLGASAAGMDLKKYGNGTWVLAQALSRAYGRFPADRLMQSRLGALIRQQPCPFPTLVDGNMHRSEWILGLQGPLKIDYEHHGFGRDALNVVDPAYDLADTILNLALSPEEECRLIRRYIAESGDAGVEQRLFVHKMLAGLWAMSQSQDRLFDWRRGSSSLRYCHERFMNAWNFLTVQAARQCGSFCHRQTNLRWRAPLVVLDVDGVIDSRLYGFPCTTAAGVKALSLLSAHEFSVALNTARSAAEVKDYCEAYSLAGGVAEYGSYIWDAVNQRERVLINAETHRQLETLRQHLRSIPGVFLDERHRYSIKAFAYRPKSQGRMLQSLFSAARLSPIGDGALVPISTPIISQSLVELRLDRLTFHHTAIDTAIVGKEVDKGTGLAALRDWVLTPDAETIAVGDDAADLAMFRVATRSFAPSHLNYRHQAELLGCRIVPHADQQGFLEIARNIVHGDGAQCERYAASQKAFPDKDDLFMTALRASDQSWRSNLRKAALHPATLRTFLR
jgi:hydroxymethylpyrimidine pyrophosphatase-like HAD family hydrolase